MNLSIGIKAMGAVRMTHYSKYVDDRAKRYLDYKAVLQKHIKQYMKDSNDYIINDLPVMVTIEFNFLPPKSYSKSKLKQVIDGRLMYTKKPDIDNLVKGVMDAMNGLVYKDDNQVISINAIKKYSTMNYINIKVEPYF